MLFQLPYDLPFAPACSLGERLGIGNQDPDGQPLLLRYGSQRPCQFILGGQALAEEWNYQFVCGTLDECTQKDFCFFTFSIAFILQSNGFNSQCSSLFGFFAERFNLDITPFDGTAAAQFELSQQATQLSASLHIVARDIGADK